MLTHVPAWKQNTTNINFNELNRHNIYIDLYVCVCVWVAFICLNSITNNCIRTKTFTWVHRNAHIFIRVTRDVKLGLASSRRVTASSYILWTCSLHHKGTPHTHTQPTHTYIFSLVVRAAFDTWSSPVARGRNKKKKKSIKCVAHTHANRNDYTRLYAAFH